MKLRLLVPLGTVFKSVNSATKPRIKGEQLKWPMFREFLSNQNLTKAPVYTPGKTTQFGDINAKRFILYYRSIIEKMPLQAYASALVIQSPD